MVRSSYSREAGAGGFSCAADRREAHGIARAPRSASVVVELTNLRVRSNGTAAIYVPGGSTASGITALSNGTGGVRVGTGSIVSGCVAYGNGGNGITAPNGNTLHGNTERSNAGFGLRFNGTRSTYRENTITNNGGTVSGMGITWAATPVRER